MKNRILALILAVFCLSTLLVGCNKAEPCEAHVDANSDNKCDNEGCDFEFCAVHKDENADLTCDVCAKTLPKCEFHKDVAVDNVCDVCCLPISVKCDIHKDDNADKVCDVCGGVIVTITEQLPPETEEKAETVVNPIPGNVNLGEYIITDKKDPDAITDITLVKKDNLLSPIDRYSVLYTFDEETEIGTYSVYELTTGKTVYSITDAVSSADTKKNITITLNNNFFTVYVEIVKIVDNGYGYGTYDVTTDVSITYYDYTLAEICSARWNIDENYDQSISEIIDVLVPAMTEVNDVKYYFFGDKVWAFDLYSYEKLGVFDEKNLVYRPAFNAVYDDKYGFVEFDGKLFVYDLTKWIECVYSYDLPDIGAWFVLDNGNVLVQEVKQVYVDGAAYDYLALAEKYDLIYTLIDVSTKTAKNVEFGYYIDRVAPADDVTFTEKAANIAFIKPIVDEKVSDQTKVVVLNNDLTIAADITDCVVSNYELVADGIFLKTEKLDETTSATYAVDVNGNVLAYIPYSATVYDNYVMYDQKLYSFDMKLVFDIIGGEYSVLTENSNFAILSKYDEENAETVYYYYAMGDNKVTPVKYQNYDGFGITYVNEYYGYVVSYLEESEDPEIPAERKYVLYNVNNEAVKSFSDNVADISEYSDTIVVTLTDGRIYIAK